mgnify:CR=1 FL=1
MRIMRFIESIDSSIDISNERVSEIIDKLSDISSAFDAKVIDVISIKDELSNYRSKSLKSNDQIDDSVSNLERINTRINDILSALDTAINSLKDYNASGRKFLY